MVVSLNANRRKMSHSPSWFTKGRAPWNKDLKGIHLSPESEFKPGQQSPKPYVPVGSERVRIDKNGKPRMFVKIADPNVWKLRAVLNWEAIHGPVQRGSVVHHKDRDTLNDSVLNLQPLDRSRHLAEHRAELQIAVHVALSVSSPSPDS